MRRRVVAAAALAGVLALPVTAPAAPAAPGTPARPAAPTVPPGPEQALAAVRPLGLTPGSMSAVPAQSWCRAVLPAPKGTARKAARIMAGRVDLGVYGWFRLDPLPSWQPAPTLDSSGKTHMHGLHWAVPLLYRGAARGDRALVDRFYEILRSWWAAFPPDAPRSSAQDQNLVAGMRVWTLTCASEMAASWGQDPALWASIARTEAQRLLDRFGIGPGTNNTGLYAQSAALAAACQAGDAAGAARALANLSALADHLVLPDGSDLEGSPHYAFHTLQLLVKANGLADRCGLPHERLDAALARAQEFLAFATRPDGVLETIGDSPGSRPTAAVLAPGGPAKYAATSGAAGQPPATTYRAFAGGYTFGRSSWGRAGGGRRGAGSATWYSIRTGRGPAATAHTHDDIGSVTIMAKGVRWIGDPGPWRYDASALRRSVVAREAHSAITVIPLPPAPPAATAPTAGPLDPAAPAAPTPGQAAPTGPPIPTWTPPLRRPDSRVTASSSAGGTDVTCLADLTYPTAAVTRCVRYDRAARTILVEDVITAREPSRIQGRWQVPPRVRVAPRAHVVALRSGKKRATLTLGGEPAGTLSMARSWFTKSYGVKARGRTLLREVDLGPGQTVTWTMEFRVK